MVTQPRWLRALALAATTAVLSSLAVALPVAAQADTAPAAGTPSTVSSDSLPTVQVNGVVWTQVIVGNTVYVGGDFSQAQPAGAAAGVGTVTRTDMLAYNLQTGALIDSFAPTFNAQVRGVAASADGSTIYAVGNFTNVNGVNRYQVVALDATTGAVKTAFNASTNGPVYTVAVNGSTVYIGGTFTIADNQTRTRAASVNATTGAVTAWAPNIADHRVQALVVSPDGSKVVLGGSFLSVNGNSSPGRGLAAVDTVTGASLPWNVGKAVYDGGDNASIWSLTSDGTNVYGTGYVFGSLADGNLEGAFNATWADGTINWIEDCHGDSYSVATLGNAVYTVSHDHYCGNVPGGFYQTDPNPTKAKKQYSLAFSKDVEGTLLHDTYGNPYYDWGGTPAPHLLTWYPDLTAGTFTGLNQAAWNLAAGNGYLLLGGEFQTVNGKRQTGLARFAQSNIAPNADGPRLGGANWTPSAVSLQAGTVRVSWPSNWDRDNANLTYEVTRNSTVVYTSKPTESEGWWVRPTLGFVDTGLTPGATVSYRVKATDPFGNTAISSTVSTTVSAGSAASAYSNDVTKDGASDYWRLGEPSGPTIYDWAGYSDMTATSGVTFGTTGAIKNDSNTAATFSGASDASSIASTQTAIPGPNTFSIETWFRTTSTAGGKIVGFGNTNTGNSSNYDRHVYMDGNGTVYFGVYPGFSATVQSHSGYNDGQWHYVVASLSSAGMQLFLDGKRVAANAGVTTAQAYNGYWRIGGDSSWAGSNYFAGDIDDTAIYPTALAATTVKNHWIDSGYGTAAVAPTDAYGKQVFADGPDEYWRLADAAGSATAADASGNGVTANVPQGGVTFGATGGIAGTSNTAATFDGNTGLVVSSQAISDPEIYTEQLWFNTTTTNGGKLIGFGDQTSGESNNYDRHIWMLDNGQLEFGVWTGQANTVTSTASYNDGKWHQVVATQGADGLDLYVDGALVGNNPTNHAQGYTGYWRLGGDHTWGGNTSDFWAGTMQDVAIYSTALTATQIANDYQLGSAGPGNTPPTATFTANPTNLSVAFDGTGSTDPDGSIVSYAWDFGDSTTGTGASPTHVYATDGTYTVTLTVTDDKGATNSYSTQVTATAANQAPTASFTANANGLGVSLDASTSVDPDGTVASYAWDFGDGAKETDSTPMTTHTYAKGGSYTVTLTVTDNQGASSTAVTHSVSVTAANQLPTAAFTASASGLALSVDGSGSTDPDGTIAGYAWDFGDGTTGSGATTSHTYTAGGSYTVTLTVTDNSGGTNATTQSVTVTAPASSTLGSDTFNRTVSNGLGTADTGGPWTTSGTASDFSVVPGSAQLATAPGAIRSAYLGNVSTASSDTSATVTLAALPTNGSAYYGLVGRRVGSDDYGSLLTIASNGSVRLALMHGTGSSLKSVAVSGLTVVPGTALRMRVQVTGSSPTTLQARVWKVSDTEPTTWQVSTTDTTAALQAPGSVGLRSYLGGGVTSGKTTFSFSGFAATTVGTPAPNTPPTASFTATTTDLTATVDGSGSTDSDGSVKAWAWNFGDGSTDTGVTSSHTYAAAGTYTVTLTVTDDQGAKGTTTQQVAVTAPTTTHLAQDGFGRTVANGLGTADVGGAWTTSGTASDFSVGSGTAGISTPKGATRSAYLGSVSATDTDVSTVITVPALPVGGTAYISIVGRRVGTADYTASLVVAANGGLRVSLARSGTSLGSVSLSGVQAVAGSVIDLRMRTTGSGTSTLQARAWLDGSVQPSTWQVTATDTTAALQAAGSVGLRTYLSSGVTNSPLAVRFDDFTADPAN